MSIIDIFRHGRKQIPPKDTATQRTTNQVVKQALASKGISVTEAEVAEVIDRVSRRLRIRRALPEELTLSETAELHFDGTAYVVALSLILADGVGQFPQRVLNTACSIAIYYAAASELAGLKGRIEFVFPAGQKLALCDVIDGARGHSVHLLFPELLNKTVLK